MTARRFSVLLIGLIAVGILVERLVVTDAEQIETLMADAESAFNEKRFDDLVELMDPDFQYGGQSREEAMAMVERLAKRFRVAGVTVDLSKLAVDGDTASARALVRLRILNALQEVNLTLAFRRTEGAWRLVKSSTAGLAGY